MAEESLPWVAVVITALAGAITALARRKEKPKSVPQDDKLVTTLSAVSTRLDEVSGQVKEARREIADVKRHAEAIQVLKAKIDELQRLVESLRPRGGGGGPGPPTPSIWTS